MSSHNHTQDHKHKHSEHDHNHDHSGHKHSHGNTHKHNHDHSGHHHDHDHDHGFEVGIRRMGTALGMAIAAEAVSFFAPDLLIWKLAGMVIAAIAIAYLFFG